MVFGEVVHYVTQSTGWPEPVRGIASLLSESPFHYLDKPGNEHLASAPGSTFSEPLSSHEAPAPGLYTAKDFRLLIQSTAEVLCSLAELPQYGGRRSTVALWSQLLCALVRTLSPDVLILQDAPFIMPRAQEVATQPSNLIDGHATLLAAHAIFAARRAHSNGSRTGSRNEEDKDESMYSADSDSCDGSVDSLDLPLQAHMLRGRGRRLSAVVPVFLVADSHNIVPLLCSTLYQRHVWGIRQPAVGLCCSSTGTIATAIFGWLDSDQSEEGRMPTVHLALAADVHSDPLMGVFDFTNTRSAISLAQFVLGLRTHFEDIKGAMSIQAVDSLNSLCWRSDLPDFQTQSNERVASWIHQVHMQTSSSEASSPSTPRTPSPLLDTALVSYDTMSPPLLPTIVEDEPDYGANIRPPQHARVANVKGRGSGSRPSSLKRTNPSPQSLSEARSSASSRVSNAYSNSQFAALPDTGLVNGVTISNWLFERYAFTIGRIPLSDEKLVTRTGINAMVEKYDQMTAFTWSDEMKTILSNAEIDASVSDIRSELCDMTGDPDSQSSEINVPSLEDVKFISHQLSALLHAVEGARQCDDIAKSRGANEADWRHQWDTLLLNFFQPVPKQRDVLLERQLNLARNYALDDSSFATRALDVAREYEALCFEQHNCVPIRKETSDIWEQVVAARHQALRLTEDLARRHMNDNFVDVVAYHSSKDPGTGKCDAILIVPYSGIPATVLQRIFGVNEQEKFLKYFMLVQGPKPEKLDASVGEISYQTFGHSRKTTSDRLLQVPSSSRVSESNQNWLHNPFLSHHNSDYATQKEGTMPSKDTSCNEPSGTDLLLPVLFAEYKKRDASAISASMNQMKIYQVSAVTFLSALGITDQPVFGLVVNGALGAITMAWKTNDRIYIMERNVLRYDIRDPLQALQFVSILLRLARHGLDLCRLLENQDVNKLQSQPWSMLHQRQEDERLVAAKRTKLDHVVVHEVV